MRIFVTGATGFLGRHLVSALKQSGHHVTGVSSIDCNLLRDDSLRRFHEPYDQIWHLAAWTQAGDFCLHHPGEQWIINQRINTNVLDWWQTRQPQARLIAVGTSCSYAPASELTEDNYLAGAPVPELFAYAMTKRMLLVGMQALASQYGLQYVPAITPMGGSVISFSISLTRSCAAPRSENVWSYGATVIRNENSSISGISLMPPWSCPQSHTTRT